MAIVYMNGVVTNGDMLTNTTGADLIANQFTILGGKCVKAADAIVSGAIGGFENLTGKQARISTFVSGEATFATANLPVYWKPATGEFSNTATVGYYHVGYGKAPIASGVLDINFIEPEIVASDVATLQGIVEGITAESGIWFKRTATLTAAAAGTAVNVLTAADVGSKTAYVMGAFLKVDGATAWTDSTGTVVKIQDTAASPVTGITYAKAQLTGNAILTFSSTGVTIGDPVAEGTGFTATKGLDIIADSNFDAGSDIKVTVFGYLA